MQKLLLVAALLCVSQMCVSQLRLGIWGGPQSASVKETNSIPGWETNIKPGYSSRSGIHLGLLVEVPISGNLYFQPSFMYSAKGRKYFQYNDTTASILSDTISTASNAAINYIEVPLNLTYKFNLSSKAKFLLSAGPYLGFFYNGKQKTETRIYSSNDFKSEESNLEAGNTEGKIKTLDAGFNVRAGFELGNVLINGFMSQGLKSFYTASYDGRFKHQVKGISLGFWLNNVKSPAKTAPVVIPAVAVPPAPKVIPDTDGDGLNDETDACPNQPGTVEFNGCPIPDSDGDGLNDKDDHCPSEPGTPANGGCPLPAAKDTIRKEVVEKLNYAAKNIFFLTNSDRLTGASSAPLNEVFELLANHPSFKLKIEGHSDASGNPESNKVLSDKRAASVKEYLINKGIAAGRLASEGFGSAMPLDTNQTPEGRARNRRVVLKLIP